MEQHKTQQLQLRLVRRHLILAVHRGNFIWKFAAGGQLWCPGAVFNEERFPVADNQCARYLHPPGEISTQEQWKSKLPGNVIQRTLQFMSRKLFGFIWRCAASSIDWIPGPQAGEDEANSRWNWKHHNPYQKFIVGTVLKRTKLIFQ